MTCKDCLHYGICRMDVCFIHANNGDTYQCQDSDKVEEDCEAFTDKSEWAHLSCKVGTQVFFLRDKNNIIETSVEKIIFKGKDGKGCYIKLECNAMYETSCQSIGKTVFFTRESAEKALEKRRKNT